VKVFNWAATMWRGSMTFEPPMLWALAFVFLFTLGGFTGLMMGVAPSDMQYHDTYFIVAHFHYVLVTGALFGIIAAVYYWLPKWTGYYPDDRLSKLHFWWSAISVNVLFFPQHFLGLAGMPRRIPDYSLQFADWNMVSSIGGFAFGLGQVFFFFIIVKTIRGGEKATDECWEDAQGLEWTIASPAPYHTFVTPPEIK
jgi:cytochrome c oxidase subunit 1